jgi:hypothetical protein
MGLFKRKNKTENNGAAKQPKSFLFATSDNKRRRHYQIQSFDLNLWHLNEKETKIDIGLKIEFNNIDDFINEGNLDPYEIKILTPFLISGDIDNFYQKLLRPNILQLLFNASYKETIDISKEETNPNSDAKFIKFLSDEDDFVLIPFSVEKGVNDNQLLLKFSGSKYINAAKLKSQLPQSSEHSNNVSIQFEINEVDGKKELSIEQGRLDSFKNIINKNSKSKIQSKCSLYFRFCFITNNTKSDNIESVPLSFFSRQVYYDIRVNEKRQDYSTLLSFDPADFLKVGQFRTFIILPNNYQLSTASTSRSTRYIRILEKSEWREYLEYLGNEKKTLFVYYWKYIFENPLNSSYSMIASYIGEHKRKIRITQMIGLVALYCFVFFFTYKFIIVPLKTEFFTNPEFKNGFYVEFTSYLITSTISFLLALTGSKYLIEKNK